MTATNDGIRPINFQLTDVSAQRQDLMSRREVKFAVPQADVAKLGSIFRSGCRAIAHNNPVSVVRSIYFDDHQLSACRANIDGLGARSKLRIRWYDTLLPEHKFFVEVKWRRNRTTGKFRYEVASDQPLSALSYPQIQHALAARLADQQVADLVAYLMKYPDPIVLVEYKRRHFAARDCDVRLTLDYDLAFYSQLGKRFISTSFRQPFPDFAVVEGKATSGMDRRLRDLLYPFSARATKCSKYVFGCRSLGLLSDL